MKIIVVYFSLDGNTKYAAEEIAGNIGADLLRLNPVKPYPQSKAAKYLWCGKSALIGETPELEAYEFDAEKYDLVIIGTPVWAANFTPPIRTFIKNNNLAGKKVALLACSFDGNAVKPFDKLARELKQSQIIARVGLARPFENPSEENSKKISRFCEMLHKLF